MIKTKSLIPETYCAVAAGKSFMETIWFMKIKDSYEAKKNH